MEIISKLLFQLSRSRWIAHLVQWTFAYWSFLLPLKRVLETDKLLVFYHPRPFWETHLLLVPKQAIPSLVQLKEPQYALLYDVLQLAVQTTERLNLKESGFVILVNGGKYQDVGQLHFHLAVDEMATQYKPPTSMPGKLLAETASVIAFNHPQPYRARHIVIQPKKGAINLFALTEADREIMNDVISTAICLVKQFDLLPAGFTLLTVSNSPEFCFHLVSGGEINF